MLQTPTMLAAGPDTALRAAKAYGDAACLVIAGAIAHADAAISELNFRKGQARGPRTKLPIIEVEIFSTDNLRSSIDAVMYRHYRGEKETHAFEMMRTTFFKNIEVFCCLITSLVSGYIDETCNTVNQTVDYEILREQHEASIRQGNEMQEQNKSLHATIADLQKKANSVPPTSENIARGDAALEVATKIEQVITGWLFVFSVGVQSAKTGTVVDFDQIANKFLTDVRAATLRRETRDLPTGDKEKPILLGEELRNLFTDADKHVKDTVGAVASMCKIYNEWNEIKASTLMSDALVGSTHMLQCLIDVADTDASLPRTTYEKAFIDNLKTHIQDKVAGAGFKADSTCFQNVRQAENNFAVAGIALGRKLDARADEAARGSAAAAQLQEAKAQSEELFRATLEATEDMAKFIGNFTVLTSCDENTFLEQRSHMSNVISKWAEEDKEGRSLWATRQPLRSFLAGDQRRKESISNTYKRLFDHYNSFITNIQPLRRTISDANTTTWKLQNAEMQSNALFVATIETMQDMTAILSATGKLFSAEVNNDHLKRQFDEIRKQISKLAPASTWTSDASLRNFLTGKPDFEQTLSAVYDLMETSLTDFETGILNTRQKLAAAGGAGEGAAAAGMDDEGSKLVLGALMELLRRMSQEITKPEWEDACPGWLDNFLKQGKLQPKDEFITHIKETFLARTRFLRAKIKLTTSKTNVELQMITAERDSLRQQLATANERLAAANARAAAGPAEPAAAGSNEKTAEERIEQLISENKKLKEEIKTWRGPEAETALNEIEKVAAQLQQATDDSESLQESFALWNNYIITTLNSIAKGTGLEQTRKILEKRKSRFVRDENGTDFKNGLHTAMRNTCILIKALTSAPKTAEADPQPPGGGGAAGGGKGPARGRGGAAGGGKGPARDGGGAAGGGGGAAGGGGGAAGGKRPGVEELRTEPAKQAKTTAEKMMERMTENRKKHSENPRGIQNRFLATQTYDQESTENLPDYIKELFLYKRGIDSLADIAVPDNAPISDAVEREFELLYTNISLLASFPEALGKVYATDVELFDTCNGALSDALKNKNIFTGNRLCFPRLLAAVLRANEDA